MFSQQLRSHPNTAESSCRLALYADEVVPGNQLSVHNRRKVWMMYWSFLEFGLHLSNEHAWMPAVAEPSDDIKGVSGGISQVFAEVIKTFFGEIGFDFRAGILVVGPSGLSHRIFVELTMILQDGGAHKAVFGCKGDAGTRFCPLCKNLVTKKSELAAEDGTNLLVTELASEKDLAFATDEDIRGALARLSHFKATERSSQFKIREQSIGFTWQAHGMLQDPKLTTLVKPTQMYCHDWCHGMMVGGVFNVVTFLVVTAIQTEKSCVRCVGQS